MLHRKDVATLACPVCRGRLDFRGAAEAGWLVEGELDCGDCARVWPLREGLADLVDEDEVRGLDRWMRFVYDRFAALHDPAVRFLLPVLQGSSATSSRAAYVRRLELERLAVAEADRPLRILEVGIGGGANLPWLERHLPADLDVELWGLDLSRGMLEQCRRRLVGHEGRRVRLLLADAHALPFADATFHRVFHVGGINGYRDPRQGLAEMARVARPQTPIVVVDEQLDPGRAHAPYFQLAFRALTLYDPAPASPRALLPPDAVDVVDEQVSRFYYCLSFRIPGARNAPGAASPGTPSGAPPPPTPG